MEQYLAERLEHEVQIPSGKALLAGNVHVPTGAAGLVLFAHGSGSSRHSPRNVYVARVLQQAGIGTVLFDLLTRAEEEVDLRTREHRFDISLLAQRLVDATHWVDAQETLQDLRVGYFGASTGSAAALIAAAQLPDRIGAVVSRGGRPDLADTALPRVKAPTLLLIGGNDNVVIELNKEAYQQLNCEKHLTIVPGASHLFEESGTLEVVARFAAEWFSAHLGKREPHT